MAKLSGPAVVETWRLLRRVRLTDLARVVRYRWRWAWQEARYGLEPGEPARRLPAAQAFRRFPGQLVGRGRGDDGPVVSLGEAVAVEATPQGLAVQGERGYLTLEAVTDRIVRLRVVRQGPMPGYASYATVLERQPVEVVVDVTGEALTLRTAAVVVTVQQRPLRVTLATADGEPLATEIELAWDRRHGRLAFAADAETTFYGLGERAAPLALGGRRFRLTTVDPVSYRPGDDPLYMNIPFLLAQVGERAVGMLFDSSFEAEIDLGQTRADRVMYATSGPEVRVDFIAGSRMAEVVEQYTALTGRMALPPLWTLGYHQSRWSYETAAIVADIAQQFRERQLPCDAIHLDIDTMDGFRCFTWNPTTFPDPAGLVKRLHEQRFRVVAMIDPGIKVDPGYAVCKEGLARRAFVRMPDGRPVHGPVWPGECYFPDFTDADVRHWWGEQYRSLTDPGVDGFWNDMNEPAVFSKATLPSAAQYALEGRGGDHREAQSVYGMQMLRATREGLDRLRPGRRNWVFTRSGYAGVQRYGSGWTGDNWSEWEHLRLTPAMLMNLGLSGMAFTGCDVGGFSGAPTPELFARWISMAAFTPFYRTHTAKHTPAQEPWSFGPEVEAIARTYLGWRYRLLPYLYTAFWQCSRSGMPVMRPLAFVDAAARYRAVDDQWLLGDHLLVSPVLVEGATDRDVLLPPGNWYDFWTGERVSGPGTVRRQAPLDLAPLHVAAGAVIPLGPAQQFSGERPDADLELHLFAGDGLSHLYEDDGETLDYQAGQYRATTFEMRRHGDAIEVSRASEGAYQPAYRQMEVVVHGAGAAVEAVEVDGRRLAAETQRLHIPADGWRRLSVFVTDSPI